ncbi:AMP-binding protein [Verticiella sediminum]|uniref:AMP-binding protein n=1 Tax=Verticiella sediminum TaxID=1247510 RepID=A0A556APN0_9BURK|nr:AMP-binding protein [Verticiella sediminum]TSH94823.1 AMP-binding protein [Verticiella sediminum]
MSTTPAASDALAALLPHVRAHSPFYREFYAGVPEGETRLRAYPVLDHARFWEANSVQGNRVFTHPLTEGITFKSGGTTGQPKYSVFTHAEFRAFTQAFGDGMRRAGLRPGEPIGNLFYAGRLYASFLFITRSIEAAGVGVCYPIGGADPDEILAAWRQFDLSTLAGVPTTLMSLLGGLSAQDRRRLRLETFLYGGEPMFPDQIAAIQEVFPGCKVRSIGIAGVDYGELGWAAGDTPGLHHSFDASTVLEILEDDSDTAIDAAGVAGRLVVTNLERRLMPIIRYPIGDRGEWVDPPGTPYRRFRLLGRTGEGARIGPMTLYVEDVRAVLDGLAQRLPVLRVSSFQIQAEHFEQRDCCRLRLAVEAPQALGEEEARQVREALYAERHMYADLVAEGIVHPLHVEWVRTDELASNPRTGKLLRVVDLRHR